MDRQTITVDIAPEGYADHRLKVSQYDVGRPLGVYIKQDGADLDCSGYTAQLYLYKPDRTNIEKLCTISGNLITWDTAEQETIVAGICVAEIRIREGRRNVGTANFTIWVEESPADTSGSSHSESQSLIEMVDRAEDAAETAESSAAIAVHAKDETVAAAEAVERFDQMTAEAETLAPGSEATAEMDYSGEHPVMKFGIPAGATGPEGRQGQQGQQGEPGVSPVVSVSDITGGHRVTITDAEGTHTFDVMDGSKGDTGETGPTGPSGYSPTVTVTDITGGHRVTITDQQGQHPFDVMDGEDSAVLSVNGKTGPVVLDGGDINVNNSASDPETIEEALGDVNRAINVLDDRVDDAESSITPLETDTATLATRTFTGGGYRKTSASGNFSYQSSTEEYTSQLIPLNGAASIKVRQKRPSGNSDGTGWSVVNFFDANEEIILNKISTNTSDDTDYTDNEYEVPSGAVYVSYLTYKNHRAEARLELNSGKSSLVDRIENMEAVLMKEESVDIGTQSSGVFYRDGEILSSVAYKITDYIPCGQLDIFSVTSYGVGDSWQWQVAFYDNNKNLLTYDYKGTGTSAEKTYEIVVPYTNCEYIRIAYNSQGNHSITVKRKVMANSGALSEMQEDIIQAQTDVEMLKDVTVMPKEVPVLATRSFTSGGYRRTTSGGTFELDTSSTSCYTSQLIALNGATTVKVRQSRPGGSATNPNAAGWSVINFFDANESVISNQIGTNASDDNNYTDNEYTVPSGAVYVSYLTQGNYRAEAYLIATYEDISAESRISAIEQNILKESSVDIGTQSSGVFYRDGEILSSDAYNITDYLPCEYGDKFKVSSNGVGDTWQWQVAYYDEYKHLLTYAYKGTGTSEYKTITVDIPYSNCAFIRVSYRNSGGISITKLSAKSASVPLVVALNKQALDDALASGANKGRFTSNSNPDSFVLLHFSDIHGTTKNLKDISFVKDYLKDVLDDTLCTGDIMASNWSNDYAFWNEASDGSILTCIGNHDVKASNAGGTGYLTNQQSEENLYGRYMENYISSWNVEHSGTNLYYYKDYQAKKIRLIVLNLLYPTAEKTTEQNTWLASALAGAKTAGYGVVIGEHYYPVSGTRINCTFSALVNFPTSMANPENYMYNGDALTTYQETVQNFIDGGGNFVCWLCGHKHADYIVYHPTYPKQVFIGVGGALFTPREMETSHTADMRRIDDTRSQNCMNVLSVDPTEKKIRVIRIGSDRDFLGRHRGTLVLDYSTSPATVEYND